MKYAETVMGIHISSFLSSMDAFIDIFTETYVY